LKFTLHEVPQANGLRDFVLQRRLKVKNQIFIVSQLKRKNDDDFL